MTQTKPHCPDSDAIMEYIAGFLPPRRAGRIAEHILGCPECLDRAAVAARSMRDSEDFQPEIPPGAEIKRISSEIRKRLGVGEKARNAPGDSAVETIKKIFIEWAAPTFVSPQYGMARGSDGRSGAPQTPSRKDHISLSQKMGALRVDMVIRKTENGFFLLVTPGMRDGDKKIARSRVTLQPEGRGPISRLANQDGAEFRGLFFGPHTLSVKAWPPPHKIGATGETGVFSFEVQEAGLSYDP